MNNVLISSLSASYESTGGSSQSPNMVDVFLVAGQSNAEGRIPLADAPAWLDQNKPIVPGLKVWSDVDMQFNNYEIGVDNGSYVPHLPEWGFDMLFGHKYHEHTGNMVYFIKRTRGGTPIYHDTGIIKGCWNAHFDWIPEGVPKLLQELHARYNLAKAFLEGYGKTINLKGLIWHQAGSDTYMQESIDAYEVNFNDVINYTRDNIIGDSDFDFIFGTQAAYSLTFNQTIQDAQEAIAAANPHSHIADCSLAELFPDRLHFNAVGAEAIAQTMFNIIKSL